MHCISFSIENRLNWESILIESWPLESELNWIVRHPNIHIPNFKSGGNICPFCLLQQPVLSKAQTVFTPWYLPFLFTYHHWLTSEAVYSQRTVSALSVGCGLTPVKYGWGWWSTPLPFLSGAILVLNFTSCYPTCSKRLRIDIHF